MSDAAFWSKVDRHGPGDCWEWQAGRHSHGYGLHRLPGERVPTYAHRHALALHLGRSIEPGASVLHSCDNPPCCNPAHLSEGDQLRNMGEASERGRINPWNVDRERCPQGHAMTPENTLTKRRRGRQGRPFTAKVCRQCNREQCAERRARRARDAAGLAS